MITCAPTGRFRQLRLFALALAVCLATGCTAELFSSLDEANANDLLIALKQDGIAATKSHGDGTTWRVLVDQADLQDALAVARRHGLPRMAFVTLGDMFKKEGLVATPSEERQRYAFAVSQELSRTLMQFEGVVSARVHPVIPVIDPLSDTVRAPSAAIFIKHLHDMDMTPLAPAIKNLVAQSIEGLDPRNVSLLFTSAAVPVPRQLPVATAHAGSLVGPKALAVGVGLLFMVLVLWPLRRFVRSDVRRTTETLPSDGGMARTPVTPGSSGRHVSRDPRRHRHDDKDIDNHGW